MSPQGTCPFTHPRSLFQDLATTRAADGLPYAEAFGARVVSRYDEIVAALPVPGTVSSFATVPEMPSPVPGDVRRPGAVPRHAARPGRPGPRPAAGCQPSPAHRQGRRDSGTAVAGPVVFSGVQRDGARTTGPAGACGREGFLRRSQVGSG